MAAAVVAIVVITGFAGTLPCCRHDETDGLSRAPFGDPVC
jgi:hypothetical protein